MNKETNKMNLIQELERWYIEQCNGDWEHEFGIKIDTLDNPGWMIKIDLADTDPKSTSYCNRLQGNDIFSADGRGARFDVEENFIGFLQPRG